MHYDLKFDSLLTYDPGLPGISLQVELRLLASYVVISAKVDTGADRCIFSRSHGEELGLDIEVGEPQRFSTPAGSFLAFGHPVTIVTGGYSFDSTVYFAAEDNFIR